MPTDILEALQEQARAGMDAFLEYKIGGVTTDDLAGIRDVSSLKKVVSNLNLSGLFNMGAMYGLGVSTFRASGDSMPMITAADVLMGVKMYEDMIRKEAGTMVALANYIAAQRADRNTDFEEAGLRSALRQGDLEKQKKKAPIAKGGAKTGKNIQKGPPATEDSVDPEVPQESENKEGESPDKPDKVPAPEERAPVPGGKEIKPGAAPVPSGPTTEGTPETTDTEDSAMPASQESGQELGEEDENEAARQLAQEKRDSGQPPGSAPAESSEQSGDEEPESPDEGSKQPQAKKEVTGGESQKVAKRELEAQKRAAELEGDEEKDKEEPWEVKMLKGWYKPVPGTLFFWWITVGDMCAIFVGEIFEATASFGYLNAHAFLSLLPIKIGKFFPEAPDFEKLTWREWMILGIVDLIVAFVCLFSLTMIIIIVDMMSPEKLIRAAINIAFAGLTQGIVAASLQAAVEAAAAAATHGL